MLAIFLPHSPPPSITPTPGTPILKIAAGHTTTAPSAPPITFSNTVALASCTKLLTTICALQAVERGLITLDAPLDAHLPELCSQPIASLDAAGNLSFRARTQPLTLRGLLTHTAGAGHDGLDAALAAWRASRGEPATLADRSSDIARRYAAPLVFEPGAGWAYGSGLDWAGKLVERLNGGVALEDYMRVSLWDPLGVRDATFRLERRPDVEERLVQTAERREGGGLGVAERWQPERPVDCMGGSGVFATVGAFLEVCRDLLQEEPRLLGKEMVEEMFKPQLVGEGVEEARKALREKMRRFAPLTGGMVPDSVRLNYGLGGLLFVDENPQIGSKSNTLTWGGHGNLNWFVNRDGNGVAALFAAQIMPSGDEQISELIKEFSQEVWKRAA